MNIDVLDYGLGNIGSVIRMVEKVGSSAKPITTPEEIRQSDKLILPGVGHFDHGIAQLVQRGLIGPLQERVVQQGTPIMGICLGMQLLCSSSEEGASPGLGYVNAEVRKFHAQADQNLKIPHMGWNTVRVVRENPLISEASKEQRFYFVHSYYVEPKSSDLAIMMTTHGLEFCAAFKSDNIFGVQFHPEKSHRFGMALMKSFVDL
jgi:imidazole glycerol-phosphate synthase subunit HisH